MTSEGHRWPRTLRGGWQGFELTSRLPGAWPAVDAAAPQPALRDAPGSVSTKKALPSDRTWFLIVFLIALAIFTATDAGRMIFDTKLGVDIGTREFLVRLWSQWNPLEWFGSLQDQYIGYAIPMAPFFLAGQLLHVPIWLIERTWLALLVAVGFVGLVKLARALQVGSDASRLLAGAVYVLWPTFTIVLGSTSAAAVPGLVVPWAVLPLISATQGRTRESQAVARSGLAITAMGGVNAVSTLAVLLLPALYILTHTRHRQRLRLSLKWGIAVIAATAWWLIPLLLQGRYSFNFLPFIEQSSTTTRTMSAAAVLRGTGTWTAYFDLSGTPWLPAGWAMVTSAAAMLASATAAAVGLAGLAMRHMPERRWLCLTVGLAAAAALSGYYGPLGGPLHTAIGHLLDGPLAPIRSMYKLEPTIAAALALGCAHAMSRCWRLTVPLWRSVRIAASAATAPLVALALAGLALPQLTGQVLQPGAFSSIPAYWHQAAAYLAVHSPRETALVVPADPHGQFTWGETIDDPLEPLAISPWVERGLVPYGGAGSQILLQTAEQAVESGQQVPGLAAYLARAGIRYVVVRNDVRPGIAGYTPPQVVNETLALSGFRMVAAFGPTVAASPDYPNIAGLRPGLAIGYPAVQVFAAANAAVLPTSPVEALPLAQTVLVNGGPDSLLQLIGQGALGSQPAVIAGNKLAGRPALWAVTDGQRRADNDFGATSDYQSFTYTATEMNPPVDPLGGAGAPPRQLLPVQAAGHQTVAVISGAASVTASSAGTWLAESMQYAPVNAFDGNAATAWAESDPATPIGQWIQINFNHSINLPASVGIRLLVDSAPRSMANQLRVTTATGSASTNTITTAGIQPLRVPPGKSTWLRITITGANNVVAGLPGAGISDVLIPGIKVASYLQPAEDPAGPRAGAIEYSFGQRSTSPYLHGQPNQQASQNLYRTFVTPSAARLKAELMAVPSPGAALDSLIARLTPTTKAQFRVTASSTWDSLPELGAANLFARNATLPWLAAANDPQPQLKISWHRPRTIRTIVLQPANGLAAAPTGVLIGSPAGDRLADVGLGGIITVNPPLRTNTLYLNFAGESSAPGNTTSGQPAQLPLGLAKVTIPALSHLHVAVASDSTRFHLGCGQGPSVAVNGRSFQTSVSGTIGDLMGLTPVTLDLCTSGGTLTLAAGRQQLTAAPSAAFTITDVSLSSQLVARSAADSAQSRRLRVVTWRADSREVTIGPGNASYLEIHENFNPGWTATLDGKALTAAKLDGWQQAFIVPAGQGGAITLTFAPAAAYHAGVIAAAIALLALLAVAAGVRVRWRRRPGQGSLNGIGLRDPSRNGTGSNGTGSNGTGNHDPQDVEFAATSERLPAPTVGKSPGRHLGNRHTSWSAFSSPHGASGHGGRHRQVKANVDGTFITLKWLSPANPRTRAEIVRSAVPYLPLLGLILVAGGPIAVVVPILAAIHRWRPRWLPAVAFACMLAAGVISATARTPTNLGSGPFSGAAQVCALIALAAAMMPVIRRRPAVSSIRQAK